MPSATSSSPSGSWGFGVGVIHDGSWGRDGGLGSSLRVNPELDLTVIVLTARMWESLDLPPAHRDIRDIRDAARATVAGRSTRN
ncbi:MAG: hypothetical protein HIU57_10190 [Acidobacteria bacterium]|nr:hypothetical protein [Acidobacteriota bacterium]